VSSGVQPRLVTSVLATALLRRAEQEGGFGTVLAKGDATAGAVAVILLERGTNPRFFERLLQADGSYAWQEAPSTGQGEDALRALIERRRRFDPDLWVLELDVASSERFAAEMNLLG
jgi:hypothetical protein